VRKEFVKIIKSPTEAIKKRFLNFGFFKNKAKSKQIKIHISGVIKKLKILDNQKNIFSQKLNTN
jgi:hypothetical protein